MLHTGDEDRARQLFETILNYQAGTQRTGQQGYWFVDILILATLGRIEEAIDAYRDAYEQKQRFTFWRIRERLGPWLTAVEQEPEFARITAAIEADLATQLRRVRHRVNGEGTLSAEYVAEHEDASEESMPVIKN